MKLHKYCALFPALKKSELKELSTDIKANGLREPIITLDGKILDGQNRFLACQLAKVKPTYEPYEGTDPVAFVVSRNLARRHLDAGQRAMIAAKIAKLTRGKKQMPEFRHLSEEEAAKSMHISRDSVQKAKAILKADKRLAKKVKSGEISLNAAHEKLHPHPQPEPAPAWPEPPQPAPAATGAESPKPHAPYAPEPESIVLPAGHFTAKEFIAALHRIEKKVADANAEAFANLTNFHLVKPLVNRQQNQRPAFNPYTR